jgi:hypothetical protein
MFRRMNEVVWCILMISVKIKCFCPYFSHEFEIKSDFLSSNMNPTKTGSKLQCSRKESSSCSTSGTHHVFHSSNAKEVKFQTWMSLTDMYKQLFVLWFTDSDYPFGICWSLCCLSFDLQILITPLVSFGHYVVCPLIYRFQKIPKR